MEVYLSCTLCWWRWVVKICVSRKKSCFFLQGFSCEQEKASSSALVSSIWCISKTRMKLHKRNSKSFTSHAFAKKDSMLNLCNPFVLLTHPPQIEQECLIHCRSVRSQISCIALVDLFGVISWRLSKMWEMLSNSEFQISTLGAKWGFRERRGEPANVDTLTVAASPWDASGIKQLSHTQKKPSKFTKTTLKTGLCCADMRDDWIVICFLSRQIAPCHFCCWLW